MHQISNDIAENMNLDHWSRKDLMDAVTYYADLAAEEAARRCSILSSVQIGLTQMVMDLTKEYHPKK